MDYQERFAYCDLVKWWSEHRVFSRKDLKRIKYKWLSKA